MPRPAVVATVLAAAALLVAALSPTAVGRTSSGPRATVASSCARFASVRGSDRHRGTRRRPFRSVQRLIDSLGAGQRGCLLGGTFYGSVRFNHGGWPGAPIVLTSVPGRRSTVAGRIYIPAGSNFITVAYLRLDGYNSSKLPSPTVDAAGITFAFDNVTTHHHGICFDLGSLQFGRAVAVRITHNRIHGCGDLPADNHQHGIYDEDTLGAVISYNYIYDNADRGINLYPDATGSLIYRNVIDGNGEGISFSGDGTHASTGNVVRDNIITNSRVRANIESWWQGPIGFGNVVTHNCIWGAKTTAIDYGGGGFRAYGNIFARPRYASRHRVVTGNFRLRRHSPCARLHAR